MSNPIFDHENPSEGMEIISPNNGIRYVFENGAWRVANVNAKDIVRMDDVSDTAIEGLVEDDKWFWWDEDKLELKIWQNNAWLPVNFQEHNADVVIQDYDDTEIRTLIDNNTNAITDEETRATDAEADLQVQIDALGGGDGKTYLESLESVLAAGRAEKIRVVTPAEWDALADKPLNTLFIVLDTTAGRGRWYLGTYPLYAEINIELPEPPPSPIKLAFSVTVGEWEGPMDADKIEAVFLVENISVNDACNLFITDPDGTVTEVGELPKGSTYTFTRSTTDEDANPISGTYTADGIHPHEDGVDDKEQVVVDVPAKPERPNVAIATSTSVDPWIDNTDPEFSLSNPDAFQTTVYFHIENNSDEDTVSVRESSSSGLVWEEITGARDLEGNVLAGEKKSVQATYSSDDLDPDTPFVLEGTATALGDGTPEVINFSETVVFPLLPGETPDVPTTEPLTRHVVVTDSHFDPDGDINASKGIAPIKVSNATNVKVIEHPTLGAGYYEVSWDGDMQNENGENGNPALCHVVNIGLSVAKNIQGLVNPDDKSGLFRNSKIGSITEERAIANDIVHEHTGKRNSGYMDRMFYGCEDFNTQLNWTFDSKVWIEQYSNISTREMFSGAIKYNKPMPWLTNANDFPGRQWQDSYKMFFNAKEFNQDISNANAVGNPGFYTGTNFEGGADNWVGYNADGTARCNLGRPQWGYDGATCIFDRDTNPETYEEEEFTIIVSTSDVAEDRLKDQFPSLRHKTYSSEQQPDGTYLIKGVWDWAVKDGANNLSNVTDIIQFGFDATKAPKPIIYASKAFYRMSSLENITAFDTQTVDFVGEPVGMFQGATKFNLNLDAHDWDIFGNCYNMFDGANKFNNGYAENEEHVMGWAPVGPLIDKPNFGQAFNGELLGWDFSEVEEIEGIIGYSHLYTNKVTSWYKPQMGGIRWSALGSFYDSDKAEAFWNNNNGFAEWLDNPQWLPTDSLENTHNYLHYTINLGYRDGWLDNADRPDFSEWTVYRPTIAPNGYFKSPNSFYEKNEIDVDAVGPDKSGRPADSPEWGDPQWSTEPNWTTQTFDEAAWHIVLRTDKVFWPVGGDGEMDWDAVADDGTEFYIPFDITGEIVQNHIKDIHSIASDPQYDGQNHFDFDVYLDHLTSLNDIPNGYTIEPIVGGDYDGFYLFKAVFSWNASSFSNVGNQIVDILQVGTTPYAHLGGKQDEYHPYVLPSKYEATERGFITFNQAFYEMDFTEIMDTGFTASDEHMWPLDGNYERMFSYSNFDADWFMNWKKPPKTVLQDCKTYQMFYDTPFNQDIRDWWLFQGMPLRNPKYNSFVYGIFNGAEKFNMGNPAGVLNVWDWKYAFQVQVFDYMFQGCRSMNIDISSWYLNEATKFDYMFKNCSMMNADLSKLNTCSMPYGFKPSSFDNGCSAWEATHKPLFGECRH